MGSKDDIIRRAAAKGAIREELASEEGKVSRLLAGRRLRKETTWPGTGILIGIKVVSQRELAEAQASAIKALRDRGVDETKMAHATQVATEYALQILARALLETPAEDARPLFDGAGELAGILTNDELETLWDAYNDHREQVAPDVEEMSEEDFGDFVEAAKKKGPETSRAIASSWPRSWLLTTAVRLATSTTSSSGDTPSSETPPDGA